MTDFVDTTTTLNQNVAQDSNTASFTGTQSILNSKGLTTYQEAIEMAYQILLRQLCKDRDDVFATIEKLKATPPPPGQPPHNRYRITMDLADQRDFIVLTLVDSKRHEFSRARFLEKRRIKNDLIAYYKPMGLFVRPPQKAPNSSTWVIDLLFRNDGETIPVSLPPAAPEPEEKASGEVEEPDNVEEA
tara:strand:- start:991 stop:1554 length:564 start_codon:yes stop_codon:yes gene_type:complete